MLLMSPWVRPGLAGTGYWPCRASGRSLAIVATCTLEEAGVVGGGEIFIGRAWLPRGALPSVTPRRRCAAAICRVVAVDVGRARAELRDRRAISSDALVVDMPL